MPLSRWFVNIHCVESVPARSRADESCVVWRKLVCDLGEGWPATEWGEELLVTTYCSLTNITDSLVPSPHCPHCPHSPQHSPVSALCGHPLAWPGQGIYSPQTQNMSQ